MVLVSPELNYCNYSRPGGLGVASHLFLENDGWMANGHQARFAGRLWDIGSCQISMLNRNGKRKQVPEKKLFRLKRGRHELDHPWKPVEDFRENFFNRTPTEIQAQRNTNAVRTTLTKLHREKLSP